MSDPKKTQNYTSTLIRHRYLFALLGQSNADLAKPLEKKLPEHERVAAQLMIANTELKFTTCVTSIDGKEYIFLLNKDSKIHQSKGNWIWVSNVEIYADDISILTLSIQPRVIDIPYTQQKVCAHWLFRNLEKELKDYFNLHL